MTESSSSTATGSARVGETARGRAETERYALGLVVIAGIAVGFVVADGRPKVIAVQSSVTFAFMDRRRWR